MGGLVAGFRKVGQWLDIPGWVDGWVSDHCAASTRGKTRGAKWSKYRLSQVSSFSTDFIGSGFRGFWAVALKGMKFFGTIVFQ